MHTHVSRRDQASRRVIAAQPQPSRLTSPACHVGTRDGGEVTQDCLPSGCAHGVKHVCHTEGIAEGSTPRAAGDQARAASAERASSYGEVKCPRMLCSAIVCFAWTKYSFSSAPDQKRNSISSPVVPSHASEKPWLARELGLGGQGQRIRVRGARESGGSGGSGVQGFRGSGVGRLGG